MNIKRIYARKYVIGNVTYRFWQRLLLLVFALSLASSGNGIAIVIGVALVLAFLVIASKSKVVMTPEEREAARQRLESRMMEE
jgi:hypothetical protein